MLEVRNLEKTFRNGIIRKNIVHAVKGVSFTIPNKQSFGIVGNSGCGKSTIARMLLSLENPDAGEIFLNGIDIVNAPKNVKFDLTSKIQMIFQHPENSLDPSKKIGSSLHEPMIVHGVKDKKTRDDKIQYLLNLVDLNENLLDRFPHQISGGEAQRVMIARALTLDPEVIILDEPTSMLDVSIQAQVMNLLKELQDKLGLSYMLISHDLGVVEWFCNEVAIMKDGAFIERGDAKEILNNPKNEFTKELIDSCKFD